MKTPPDSLGFLVADVARLMRRAFEQRLEGSSLTLAQARALVHLARNEGIRQVDLAETLEIQPITLARLLDQLAAEGLIERRAHAGDRRAWQVFLTPAATAHLAAIEEVAAAIRADALAGFTRPEAAAIRAALIRMRSNLGTR